MTPNLPENPTIDGLEAKWQARWEAEGTYRFDRTKSREQIYAIDTPPPTVSGSLHVGHIFSYTHTDAMARFFRMSGKEVFYPMGWDDNGLPTERRVQNYYGVRCDPSLPYTPDLGDPTPSADKRALSISRPNFVELCRKLTDADERVFEALFRHVGLSVDWSLTYTTIGDRARRVSQRAFLRLLDRGQAYQVEAPTMWDVDFRTAVAQAELEDREVPGEYHRIRFPFAPHGSEGVDIETTRPELLPACVALVAHPDDARYQPLFGKTVYSPLFSAPIPVYAHKLANPEKGLGIAMICTFGDQTDVIWWRDLKLPMRALLTPEGRLAKVEWGAPGWESADAERAQIAHDQVAGLTTKQAKKKIVELLGAEGAIIGAPRPISHAVKFFEKGSQPLEILTSRQWFVPTLDLKEPLLARGQELKWHPDYMRGRYESWVQGLNIDWCISRQRFFGVPFPVWYRVREDGSIDYANPIRASEAALPVDPSTDVPPGYTSEQRGQPGGFVGDPDVMDTWATSSLTPQIAAAWEDDPDLFGRVFPMDLRPQAHEIIRTWLFTTVLRSHLEHKSLPWSNAAISGWILDPDRKKMSKSAGNVVTPMALLEKYGSDAVRYWAVSARPGTDTAFDEGQMKIGRRLALKILNASRFVLPKVETTGDVTAPIDRALVANLATLVEEVTADFEAYDYARALDRAEKFFWKFCDDYLEIVKTRSYGHDGEAAAASANRALGIALSTLLRLFAPHLPFVTEEVWSWWQPGSVHRAKWPTAAELRAIAGEADPTVLAVASDVLGEVRRVKTKATRSMKAEVASLVLTDTPERLAAFAKAEKDVRNVANVRSLTTSNGDAFACDVTLAEEPSQPAG
jgi:valyl-tRNA synthetase